MGSAFSGRGDGENSEMLLLLPARASRCVESVIQFHENLMDDTVESHSCVVSSLQRRHVVHTPLFVEEIEAITLWRLGTNVEYRSIVHLFVNHLCSRP